VKSILAGEQYSSIFKDTPRTLPHVTADMVDALLTGKTVTGKTTPRPTTMGVKVVPSYLLKPRMVIDKEQLGAGSRRQRLLQAETRSN